MKTNKLLAAGALALSMTMSPFASLISDQYDATDSSCGRNTVHYFC